MIIFILESIRYCGATLFFVLMLQIAFGFDIFHNEIVIIDERNDKISEYLRKS